MTKYHCTVIFDASAGVTVEADTPEDAAEQAENETQGRQHLCHQCSNDLETGDSLGVLVYNEEYTDELLDTRYKPQRKPLTDEQIKKAMMDAKLHFCGEVDLLLARAIEAAHGIKEKNT